VQPLMHNAEKPSIYAGVWVVGDGIEVGCGRGSDSVARLASLVRKIPKIRVYGCTAMSHCAKSGHRKGGHF